MSDVLRVIVMGNAGAGKTTLARALMSDRDVPRLSLDDVAFADGAERRLLADSVGDALAFVGSHDRWIVEGCYADIIEPLLPQCEVLVFLNPGVETCLEHCRKRPWEPEKFSSASAQDENLANLLGWVREYERRTDEYGLQRHRRLFDAFPGRKLELARVEPEDVRRILAAEA